MDISDLVSPQGILPRLACTSKKQVLDEAASCAARLTGGSDRDILAAITERERLGSTAAGRAIAIPHGKLPGLDRPHVVFVRLDRAIDFDAADRQPVDLVFLLLAPASPGSDHLKALARVSRLARDRDLIEKLRATDDPKALYALLSDPSASRSDGVNGR